MLSNLLTIDSSISTFFNQLTEAVGFVGYLAIAVAVEILFILLFVIKSTFSYEARLKRRLDKANEWIFANKKINTQNIKAFNKLIKKGPKRFAYYWQQFILNREGGPAAYMTEENIIEKPLKTSSWNNNVKVLTSLTIVWSIVSLLFGVASQSMQSFTFQSVALTLVFPCVVLAIGVIAIIIIRGVRALNLDDIYHLYNIFARFVTNATDELPPYIDFNLLFTPKEIEKGNAQIRQYYEEMARQAKKEFEEAKKNEENAIDYNFKGVGVDGALLLERAMKESERYINTKNSTLSKIAQIEAQKEALRRTYDDVQMDLQRKLQASKENITKLVEQQATTTNRFEIGRLRERQDKEIKKQEALQEDYDKEEKKFLDKKNELDKEIEDLSSVMVESLDTAEKGMTAEYQSFFKKVMKSAYSVAENKVKNEKKSLQEERDSTEEELINVQTQNKRLLDENETLRAKIEELLSNNTQGNQSQQTETAEKQPEGRYDEEGNFVYSDGSYHDTKGLFHDVDGKVYDLNGVLVKEEQKTSDEISEEQIISEQIDNFGTYVVEEEDKKEIDDLEIEKEIEKELNSESEAEKEQTQEENKPIELETTSPVAYIEEKIDSNIEETPQSPKAEEEIVVEKEEPKEIIITEPEHIDNEDEEPGKTEPAENETKKKNEPASQAKKPKKRGRKRKSPVSRPTYIDENSPVGEPGDEPAFAEDEPKSAPKRGRGRPRKTEKEKTAVNTTPRKRGRPRKNAENEIDKLNKQIIEEEKKLKNINQDIDQQLNSAMNQNDESREEMLQAIEQLKKQADEIKGKENSTEELAEINKKIEALIFEISKSDGNK